MFQGNRGLQDFLSDLLLLVDLLDQVHLGFQAYPPLLLVQESLVHHVCHHFLEVQEGRLDLDHPCHPEVPQAREPLVFHPLPLFQAIQLPLVDQQVLGALSNQDLQPLLFHQEFQVDLGHQEYPGIRSYQEVHLPLWVLSFPSGQVVLFHLEVQWVQFLLVDPWGLGRQVDQCLL